MTARWTARALNSLREVRDYIAKDSPAASQRMTTDLVLRARQLSRFPLSGSIVSDVETPGIRELVELSYRLYMVQGDDVLILAVVHGHRDLRSFLRTIKEPR